MVLVLAWRVHNVTGERGHGPLWSARLGSAWHGARGGDAGQHVHVHERMGSASFARVTARRHGTVHGDAATVRSQQWCDTDWG